MGKPKANKKVNMALGQFVKHKWDGKKSYEEFIKEEQKLWNDLPASDKRV